MLNRDSLKNTQPTGFNSVKGIKDKPEWERVLIWREKEHKTSKCSGSWNWRGANISGKANELQLNGEYYCAIVSLLMLIIVLWFKYVGYWGRSTGTLSTVCIFSCKPVIKSFQSDKSFHCGFPLCIYLLLFWGLNPGPCIFYVSILPLNYIPRN